MAKNLLTDRQRTKEDHDDDSLFYSQPRFAYHLDEAFRSRLSKLYSDYILDDSVVLDLMSSWVSHLPNNKKYKQVIGHGMNQAELERNKQLDSFWIQNLNLNQKLPFDDSTIDVCLMAAAWQYLQYPEDIAAELRRIIKRNGLLIVSFSNRAFWSKTPLIWRDGSDSQHINYIKAILTSEGWSKFTVVAETTSAKGIRSFFGQIGDPFFSIIAINQP